MIQQKPGIAAASMMILLVLMAGCTTTTRDSTTTLTADLSGADAAPDPGDANGTGSATITLDTEDDEVCWDLTVEDIDTATAAHIHRGEAGEAGPVVVPLSAPDDGSSDGCNDVESGLIDEIIDDPSAFYVNVHNEPYPDGAIRGQLSE